MVIIRRPHPSHPPKLSVPITFLPPFPGLTHRRRFATPEALASISRTLRPAGRLGLIWNIEDYNQAREYPTKTRWESDLRTINWKYTTDASPRYKNHAWAAAFQHQSLFGPVEEKIFEVKVWLEKEALWQRLGTLSNIANLSDGEKDVSVYLCACE